jgi:putative transposase
MTRAPQAERGQAYALDDSHWPAVDEALISDNWRRSRYQRLRNAIGLLRGGHTYAEAAKAGGVSVDRLGAIVARCKQVAPDGRPAGYRACVFGWRAGENTRTAPFVGGRGPSIGYTGLFRKLLADRPDLERKLTERVLRIGVRNLQTNRIRGRNLRRAFVEVCKECGLGDADYPLNTQDRGLKSLRRWITTTLLPKYARQWTRAEYGPTPSAILGDRSTEIPDESGDPNEDWIIDEVTVNMRARYELLSMHGDWDSIELKRFCVLRAVHGGTGAVMASHAVLAAQATAADLGQLVFKALAGSPRLELTVPDLAYDPGAGYPADCVEGMRWLAPKRVYLDNALSHLAADANYLIEARMGAGLRLGRPAYPIERASIESNFAAEARRVTHQLPGTTGTGPSEETKAHRKLPVERLVRAVELVQVLEVYVANTNAAPHAASNGIAPLERMRRMLARGQLTGVLVPVESRRRHMFSAPIKVTVRSDLKRGRKPFIVFKRVRYSSALLQNRFDLVNQPLWLHYDSDDLRVVVLFAPNGAELGPVRAVGRWGLIPHDLRIRNMAMKLLDEAQQGTMPHDCPVMSLLAHLRNGAPRDKRTGLQYAYVMEYLQRHLGTEEVAAQQTDAMVVALTEGGEPGAAAANDTAAAEATPVAKADDDMTPRRVVRR